MGQGVGREGSWMLWLEGRGPGVPRQASVLCVRVGVSGAEREYRCGWCVRQCVGDVCVRTVCCSQVVCVSAWALYVRSLGLALGISAVCVFVFRVPFSCISFSGCVYVGCRVHTRV